MTKVIITLMLLLQGCSIYPNDHLLKLFCDGDECELRTNILICDDENIYCQYIDVPLFMPRGNSDEKRITDNRVPDAN